MKRRSQFEFFKNGPENQKSPDIVIDMQRVGRFAIEEWTPEQKRQALQFFEMAQAAFDAFAKELTNTLKGLPVLPVQLRKEGGHGE